MDDYRKMRDGVISVVFHRPPLNNGSPFLQTFSWRVSTKQGRIASDFLRAVAFSAENRVHFSGKCSFQVVAFSAENRGPLFRKMLYTALREKTP
jgi:hypothetical protein